MEDTSLEEILRSPLDDMPERRVPPWMALTVGFGVAAVVGILALTVLTGGGDDPPATTVAAVTTAPGDGTAGTDAPSVTTSIVTTTAPVAAEIPVPIFRPEPVVVGDSLAVIGGYVPAGSFGRVAVLETFFVDPFEGTATAIEGPGPVLGHGAVHIPDRDAILVFGGGSTEFRRCQRVRACSGSDTDDMWWLDLGTGEWEQIEAVTPGPSPRFGHAMVFDPETGLVVVFGGARVPDRLTAEFPTDTWVLDPDTLAWEERSAGPSGRAFPAATVDPAGGRLLLYGGEGPGDEDVALWAYDIAADEWSVIDDDGEPLARWQSSLVHDPATGELLLLGGSGPRETALEGGSGTRTDIVVLLDVWAWSVAEGWMERNPIPEEAGNGAARTAADSVFLFDLGAFVWSYDAALDEWAVLQQ
jgi:hypothetical protein